MKVAIEFDRPFHGMIFSKGHYSDGNCVYLQPGSGLLTATFDVFLNNCGTSSSVGNLATYGQAPSNAFIENTIIIQYDALVQEVWDQARKLRCTWYDYYEKTVTLKPFLVDTLQAVQANFLGDNIQCWMQIQVGQGPWATEVDGIVKIGQKMTMVLAIKDEENKFDMLVRNCVAHDGKRPPISLVDDYGCVARPKVMSPFQKIRNFDSTASVVSYAFFQAFKFPDSMNVFFQCIIQVCRHQCPEPNCGGEEFGDPRLAASAHRDELSVSSASSSSSHHAVKAHLPPQPPQPPQPQNYQPPGSKFPAHGPPHQANIVPHPPIRAPFPLPLNPGYTSVGRDGVANVTGSYSAGSGGMNGRPRAADLNKPTNLSVGDPRRLRRGIAAPPAEDEDSDATSTDKEKLAVPTAAKMIRVVAPGDVAFNLGTGNETVVIANSSVDGEKSSICMTMPSFVAGLVILLSILVVACLVASFLFIRMRAYHRKDLGHYAAESYDNPEFVKSNIGTK